MSKSINWPNNIKYSVDPPAHWRLIRETKVIHGWERGDSKPFSRRNSFIPWTTLTKAAWMATHPSNAALESKRGE